MPDVDVVIVYGVPKNMSQLYQVNLISGINNCVEYQYYVCSCLDELDVEVK